MKRCAKDAAMKVVFVMGTAVLMPDLHAETPSYLSADVVRAPGQSFEMMFQPEGVFWR